MVNKSLYYNLSIIPSDFRKRSSFCYNLFIDLTTPSTSGNTAKDMNILQHRIVTLYLGPMKPFALLFYIIPLPPCTPVS